MILKGGSSSIRTKKVQQARNCREKPYDRGIRKDLKKKPKSPKGASSNQKKGKRRESLEKNRRTSSRELNKKQNGRPMPAAPRGTTQVEKQSVMRA